MGRPRTHWSMWVALAVVVGVAVTWAVTSRSSPDSRRVRLPEATPATAEAEPEPRVPSPVVPPVAAHQVVAAAEAAAGPGMTFGVAVLDVHTGELSVGRGGERAFMSASLSKLIVAVDVLDRHRAQGRLLDPVDLDLIGRALSGSDDGAMNVLWGKHDGAGAIGRVAGRLGLTARLPPDATRMWGDTEVTAADMVSIYRHVLVDMAPGDGAVIIGALSTVSAVATDGFGQHYGLLHEGASPRRYAKQAWVPYSPAGYLLHSAGVAYDGRTGHAYAIALLSIQPHTDEQTARDRLSAIAAAAVAPLTA
jgi:hypothetical protein